MRILWEYGQHTLQRNSRYVIRDVPELKDSHFFFSLLHMLLLQKAYGIVLPFRRSGYSTVVEYLGTVNDIVSIERPTEKDWLIKPYRPQAQGRAG